MIGDAEAAANLLWEFNIAAKKEAKLTKIKKNSRNIGGELKKDLQEQIDNSITIHWVVVHRNKIRDYINYLLNEYLV